MNAKELNEALKPLVLLGPLADRVGVSQSAWYTAVRRQKQLSPEECKAWRAALKALRGELQAIEKRIK
jgi:hypothetical protein